MIKKDIYYFKKVLKKYKEYRNFKKGLHECIEEYTQYTYHSTWKQVIGKVCLENNDFSMSSMIAYLSKEHNMYYTTHDMIKIVIKHILFIPFLQEKIANEIHYEMMKND